MLVAIFATASAAGGGGDMPTVQKQVRYACKMHLATRSYIFVQQRRKEWLDVVGRCATAEAV